MKHTSSLKKGKHFGNTDLKRFTLWSEWKERIFILSHLFWHFLNLAHNVLAILTIVLYFLFHGLHFATTFRVLKPVLCFRMTTFNYRAKQARDVDPACRSHQSNIIPDSINVNIAQCVTCLCVFRFVLFYVYIKGWYSGIFCFFAYLILPLCEKLSKINLLCS